MQTTIKTVKTQGWLTITLAQPDKRNALTATMVDELATLLAEVADDRAIRGITLTGAGKVFCAGGDLKGFHSSLDDDSLGAITETSRQAGALFHQVNTMPQVVFMRVHGAAIAGGLGLMCGGDVIAVTRDARFALTETQLGIVPAQIAPLVAARVGMATARRLMLTGAQFDGSVAQAIGLADFVNDDEAGLDAIEAETRAQVLRCAPGAIAATKQLLRDSAGLDQQATIALAADVFAGRLASEEGREGISAFIEKRKPEWQP